ncbi:MAG TPA: hypothetical protein VJ777_27400 [Mycobacterium sp.]|nr:hypothetical protein [Mycobacterium sp.]
MQILASALPGFRDLRAPLAAGYMWLVFAWVLIKPDITTRPSNEVAAAVYDLASSAGPIWIGLATGVVAYLVGSVSQAVSPALSRGMSRMFRHLETFGGKRMQEWMLEGRSDKLSYKLVKACRKVGDFGTGAQHDAIAEYELQAVEKLYANPTVTTDGRVINPDEEIGQKGSAARRALDAELELPATLLLGKEPELFSEADRLKAERELRLAVVPPLSAVSIYLACNQTPWWLFALVPVAVLLLQGHTRNLAFRSLMIGAVQLGAMRSRSVEDYKQWVREIPVHTPEEREAYARAIPDQTNFGRLGIEIRERASDMGKRQQYEFGDFSDQFAYRGFEPNLHFREPDNGDDESSKSIAVSVFLDTYLAPELLEGATQTAIDVVTDWAQNRIGNQLDGYEDQPLVVALYGPEGNQLKLIGISGAGIEDLFTHTSIAKVHAEES